MRKPILPKARKVRRADRSVAIELDAHLGVLVLRLEPKRSAFELIHSFFINLDVPIKRGLVATLEKINVGDRQAVFTRQLPLAHPRQRVPRGWLPQARYHAQAHARGIAHLPRAAPPGCLRLSSRVRAAGSSG